MKLTKAPLACLLLCFAVNGILAAPASKVSATLICGIHLFYVSTAMRTS